MSGGGLAAPAGRQPGRSSPCRPSAARLTCRLAALQGKAVFCTACCGQPAGKVGGRVRRLIVPADEKWTSERRPQSAYTAAGAPAAATPADCCLRPPLSWPAAHHWRPGACMPRAGQAAEGWAWKGAWLGCTAGGGRLTNCIFVALSAGCRADQACSGRARPHEGLPAGRLAGSVPYSTFVHSAAFRSSFTL